MSIELFDFSLQNKDKLYNFYDDDKEDIFIKLKSNQCIPDNLNKTHKKCLMCMFAKPFTLFNKCSINKDGMKTYCNECCKLSSKILKTYLTSEQIKNIDNMTKFCRLKISIKIYDIKRG